MSLKELCFRFNFFYKLLPVHFLMKLANKSIILPFYHFVNDGENRLTRNLYLSKTKKQFIEDIQYLKTHFTAVSINHLQLKKHSKNNFRFILSFDDGLANFYNVVAPILVEEEVYCINFLNSSFIDNKELFYRYKVNILIELMLKIKLSETKKESIIKLLELKKFNKKDIFKFLRNASIHQTTTLDAFAEIVEVSFSDFLEQEKPYMSKNQILELKNKGFGFGAHSKNHPRYSQLNLKDQLKESLESLLEINELFSLKNNFFAFPFSDDGVKNEFFEIIVKEKMLTFGSSGLKDDEIETHYQRIPMEFNTIYSAETIIKGELIYYILKKLIGKHKTKRK